MAIDAKRAVGTMLAAAVLVSALASCSGDDGAPEAPDQSGDDAGAAGDSGQGGSGGSGGDGVVNLEQVPPTVTAFSTLGEPRGGDGLTLRGDGFEHGERRCSDDGQHCVTGGFEP